MAIALGDLKNLGSQEMECDSRKQHSTYDWAEKLSTQYVERVQEAKRSGAAPLSGAWRIDQRILRNKGWTGIASLTISHVAAGILIFQQTKG